MVLECFEPCFDEGLEADEENIFDVDANILVGGNQSTCSGYSKLEHVVEPLACGQFYDHNRENYNRKATSCLLKRTRSSSRWLVTNLEISFRQLLKYSSSTAYPLKHRTVTNHSMGFYSTNRSRLNLNCIRIFIQY